MHLLKEIDLDVAKAKEEALSRKEILDKVEKWLAMCQEESWLEEYNRVGNFGFFSKEIAVVLNCKQPL